MAEAWSDASVWSQAEGHLVKCKHFFEWTVEDCVNFFANLGTGKSGSSVEPL